ncbi:MAG: hypothetical protein KatS3mg024_2756 [Armatimonadota bacterium]|nr:MAG: hypothetical protein KatS3mg024_2756 [Armatimonadota bacterium]
MRKGRAASLCIALTLAFALLPVAPVSATRPDIKWMAGGHTNGISCVAYSPDGQTLASGSWDGTIKVWRVADGLLIRTLTGPSHSVFSIAFSPDGQILASGNWDGTINIWRIAEGALIRRFSGHADAVTSVAFSPDGQTLATGSWDSTIRLWLVWDGSLIRTLTGHLDDVLSVAFSPDGQTLASGSDDKSIRIWRVSDGSPIRTLTGHAYSVYSVAFSPDGQILASGSWDNTIRLWRVSDGTFIRTLTGHTASVNSVAFSPDGQTLASGSYDLSIRFWRISDGTILRSLAAHTSAVNSVAFSPDGQTLASGSGDNSLKIWRVSDGSVSRKLTGHSNVVTSVAFSPDGQTLASGSQFDTILLWRVSDGSLIRTFPGQTSHFTAVAFSPDGQILASGRWDGSISLWRVSDGSLIRTIAGHTDDVTSVAFSPDGQILATGSHDKVVRLWRVSDGAYIRGLSGHGSVVYSLAFSPNGQFLASGSWDNTIRLWRVSQGTLIRILSGHAAGVNSVAFSPDGQTLASGSEDNTIRFWRVLDGSLLYTLWAHTNGVKCVAFAADGQILASGSYDLTIKFWKVSDGTLVESFDEETARGIASLAFSPGGTLLAWGRGDATVTVAFAPTGDFPASQPVRNNSNGHYYEFVRMGVTWAQADVLAGQRFFNGLRGHLATITTAQEQQFITQQLLSRYYSDGAWWVGGFQDSTAPDYSEPAGGWRWVSGETWSYTNWCPGEPNNYTGNDSYVEVWTTPGCYWADTPDTTNRGFIVEYAPYSDTTPPSTPIVMTSGLFSASTTQLSAGWLSSDPGSGIVEYTYAIGTSPADTGSGYVVSWRSAGTATEITYTGLSLKDGVTYYWYVRARNGAGLWSNVGVSNGITIDTSPPSRPAVTDTGRFTSTASGLSASWSASDPHSGIAEYRYAIGTTPADPGSGYVVAWKSVGSMTQASETGLNLQSGVTYYWYVQARNGAGSWSPVGASDGIYVAVPVLNPANGHYYQYVPGWRSWEDAAAEAATLEYQGLSGHLATVTSQEEWDWLVSHMSQWCPAGFDHLWLGGYQDRQAPDYAEPLGGWRWVTGEVWNWTRWHSGEPNDRFYNGDPEHYLAWWHTSSESGWNDFPVYGGISDPDFHVRGYLVEYDVPDTTPPAMPVVTDTGRFTSNASVLSASWSSTDPESGIVEYQYAIGTSPTDPGSGYLVGWKSAGFATEATETDLNLQDGVTYYWYVKARNGSGLWSAVGVSDGITVDLTAPDTSITGGPANSSLSRNADATFTFAGTDNLTSSSALRFQWRLDNAEWSTASTEATVHLTNIVDGVHTFQLRALDLVGNVDPTPASVTWRVLAGSLPVEVSGAGRAKLQADGVELLLTGCVVTAAPGQTAAGRAYVESLDRSAGLAILTDLALMEGQVIEAVGRMSTNVDGERVLTQPFIRVIGQTQPLEPVWLTLANAAGGPFFHSLATGAGQRGVTDPAGRSLNTTGLLVRVSGWVSEIDSNFIYINEGSLPVIRGVRVSRLNAPSTVRVNDFVKVTGISSMRRAGLSYQLVIRPRSSADFQVVTHADEP